VAGNSRGLAGAVQRTENGARLHADGAASDAYLQALWRAWSGWRVSIFDIRAYGAVRRLRRMTPRTPAQRQQALRDRRRAAGLRPYEVWALPTEWPMIKLLLERLAKERSEN